MRGLCVVHVRFMDAEYVIRVLSRALEKDLPAGSATMNHLAMIVNATMVFTGVRQAARLEYYLRGSATMKDAHFFRAVRTLCGKTGGRVRLLSWGLPAARKMFLEPVLADTARCRPRDVEILEQSTGSDLVQPLLGAMGRILQYSCAYSLPSAGATHFQVRVQNKKTGALRDLFVAQFMCRTTAELSRAVPAKMTTWVMPACKTLVGREFTLHKDTYVIVGAQISLKPFPEPPCECDEN